MAPSLRTTVGGVSLECCIYNASGPKSGHVADLANIGKTQAGAVLSKSATLEKQSGNPLPRLKKIPLNGKLCEGSINSEGLPNAGIDYYISDTVLDGVAATGKPYIVSLSGLKVEHNVEMLGRIVEAHGKAPKKIAGVELNLACPNIPGKPTVALDFEQMDDVLKQVLGHKGFEQSGLPLGIKLAPYFDGPHYDAAAAIINKHKSRIAYVVTMNTIGNCLVVDTDTESALISPKGGFGGIGGGFTKPIALANVYQLRQRLDPSIGLVGVGGVRTGEDAFQLILCGADAVQTATTHWLEGPACFDRIASELSAIMVKKGYNSISEFKGKMKPYDKTNKPKEPPEEAPASGGVDTILLMLVMVLAPLCSYLLWEKVLA